MLSLVEHQNSYNLGYDSYKLTKTYREWFDGPDDWVHLRGIFTATNCSQAW